MKNLNYTNTNAIATLYFLSEHYYNYIIKYWFEIIFITLLAHLITVKNIKISIGFKDKQSEYASHKPYKSTEKVKVNWATPVSFETPSFIEKKQKKAIPKKVHNAQSFYNLTFILSPTYATRKGIPNSIVEEKRRICLDYISKYLKTAQNEQREYGIPVSITLAQGLLESNAGASRLAKESDNHFGIKCRSKCKGCTCKNYKDDDIYDMFRVFENPWESYREHSILLNSKRYRHLKKYGKDYKKWAYGLKKAGYATDKRYAQKLIQIIEALRLQQYDSI